MMTHNSILSVGPHKLSLGRYVPLGPLKVFFCGTWPNENSIEGIDIKKVAPLA